MKSAKYSSEPITAAVVGLGSIGMGLDYDTTDSGVILTHCGALQKHSGFKLVGGVDPDSQKRAQFEKKFRCEAFPDLASMFSKKIEPDLIVLSVPTKSHAQEFRKILTSGHLPKILLCEKPLAENFADSKAMIELAESKGVTIAVNFVRRFEPGVKKVRDLLSHDVIGGLQKGLVWYSKGLLNNGSHFIDLLHFWLGSAAEIEICGLGHSSNRFGEDPDPDFLVRFGNSLTPIYFLSACEKHFSMREVELIGEKGAIYYRRGGMEIIHHSVEFSSLFQGYQFLGDEGKKIQTELARVQWFVFEHIFKHLKSGEALPSTGRTALAAMEVVEKVKNQWKQQEQLHHSQQQTHRKALQN